MKHVFSVLLLSLAALLGACNHPGSNGIQVIVGARLDAGTGHPELPYSVVVVANGKIQAVGSEATTPVPPGAAMTRGMGMTIEPAPGGGPIEAGRPANLVLKGATERVMRDGQWVN
jgi:hypothetical protein